MQKQTLLRKSGGSTSAAGSAVERGLPLAFARAAEETLELPLLVTSATTDVLLLDELALKLDDEGLFLILEGPDGATGAAIVSNAMIAALLEHLTMGRVLGRPLEGDRQPTAVDAALVSPVLDDLLAECDLAFADLSAEDWAPKHRFGSMIEDRRTLILSLANKGFSLINLELSFADAIAVGRLQLLLPNAAALAQDEHSEDQQNQRAEFFRDNVLQASTELRVVLSKLTMPFDRLEKLAIGDVLEIPASALQDIVLEMHDGEEMARAALGQVNGQRAVQVQMPAGHQQDVGEKETLKVEKAAKPTRSKIEPGSDTPQTIEAQAVPDETPNIATGIQPMDDFDIDLDDLDKLAQA